MKGPILVTGASGLLGGMLLWRWRNEPEELLALVRNPERVPTEAWPGVTRLAGDLERPEELARVIIRAQPGLVVNCAAATLVDPCQEDPAMARGLNAAAAGKVAEAARETGAGLVQISTDAVYAEGPGPHAEDQAGGDLSVYARTKLEGEAAALTAHPRALVLRTCLFGYNQDPGRASLAEWMLARLKAGENLPGFTDVAFNPVFTATLAWLILEGVRAGLTGVYNVGSDTGMSKHDFGRALARAWGLDPDLVRPTLQAQASLKAPRPIDPTMDSRRFFSALGQEQPSLEGEIAAFHAMEHSSELTKFRRFGGRP